MMRPAQGVSIHPTHMGVIGFPVVMNNCPAVQEGWNSTALGADAVMRPLVSVSRIIRPSPVASGGKDCARSFWVGLSGMAF